MPCAWPPCAYEPVPCPGGGEAPPDSYTPPVPDPYGTARAFPQPAFRRSGAAAESAGEGARPNALAPPNPPPLAPPYMVPGRWRAAAAGFAVRAVRGEEVAHRQHLHGRHRAQRHLRRRPPERAPRVAVGCFLVPADAP